MIFWQGAKSRLSDRMPLAQAWYLDNRQQFAATLLIDISERTVKRCDAAFKREVLLRCYEGLAHEGFTRFRKESADWPLQNGFHCWVGLNTALTVDYVEINPFVGVHVVPIMKLYTWLEGRKYDRSIATYARHIGELAPDERVVRFTRETDVELEAARLARLCATVGLAFAKAIADYESLLPLLRSRIDMLGAYPERLSCCLYLMGRKHEAKAFVERFLPDNRDYFEGFAIPFLKMLAKEDQPAQTG